MNTWTHSRTEVHNTIVNNLVISFLTFNEQFRMIRKDDKACCFCRKSFEEGDTLNLAFTDKGNKLICTPCCEPIVAAGVFVRDQTKYPENEVEP